MYSLVAVAAGQILNEEATKAADGLLLDQMFGGRRGNAERIESGGFILIFDLDSIGIATRSDPDQPVAFGAVTIMDGVGEQFLDRQFHSQPDIPADAVFSAGTGNQGADIGQDGEAG